MFFKAACCNALWPFYIADQTDLLYLSVDADILAAEWIPAYAKYVPDGHSLETVKQNVQIVMDGITIGIVTLFNNCQLDAPSIFAASINSPGIFWIPAI